MLAAELRALYRKEGHAARKKATRQGIWVAVAVYLMFSISDLILIPDVAANTISARVLIGVMILALFETQYRMNASTDGLDITCAAAVFSVISAGCGRQ